MSTTPVTPNPAPMSETSGLPGGMQQYSDYLKAQVAQQANTTGLTQMGPNTGGSQAPATKQRQEPGAQQNRTFGPGEGAARKREAQQNLIKSAQGLANQFGQYKEQKQQREYQQVLGRFTQATQGVNQAQAQIQQAGQALKQNPQDPQAQQMLQQAQGALKQNQTILNDMANDNKQHKIITKAFGVDDKNADSPERAAAKAVMQKQMGVGPQAAGIMSQLPQTQQLSPQAQAQQQARQAGVVGAPATQGQILAAEGRVATEEGKTERAAASEAGKTQRATAKDQLTAALNGQKYNDKGEVVPMTADEISKNPVLSAKIGVQATRMQLQQAQADLDRAKTSAIPEQIKMAESRVSAAQGNLMMRQKEFGIKVAEEERKQLETSVKTGGPTTGMTPDGKSVDISGVTQGRPLQSWAQQTVVQTQDRLSQVNELMQKLDPLKDNNTPGYLATDRLGYAMGIGGENGKLASEVSNIELQRVVNAAQILKGSSRSWGALQAAMIHTPNAWVDSPKLMYQKLQTIQKNLQDMQTDAVNYGQKGQHSSEMPGQSKPAAKPSGNLTFDPTTGTVK
jgi:hypothetical protein